MRSANYFGYTVFENGDICCKKGKTKKIHTVSDKGYYTLQLWDRGKAKYVYLHRILAKCFIPNPENNPCVNHKNGIKTDNRLENLEWCTYRENTNHSYLMGLQKKLYGENNKQSMIILQFNKKGDFIKEYIGISNASRLTGINKGHISSAINGNRKSAGNYIWVKK